MTTSTNRDEVRETQPKRVKVYILENNEWKDTGTGFCTGEVERNNKDADAGTRCTEQETSSDGAKLAAYLLVNDESAPEKILLKSKLEGNIEYQRQEETLIVWKDLAGQDIALSFEESTGCDALCDFVIKVQKKMENNISLVAVRSNDDGMGSVHEIITGPVNLPTNDPVQNEKTLLESLKILNENTSFDFLRNETVEFILQSNYINTLIKHFHNAEKNHLYKDLLLLSNIVKTLILYNQRDVLERLVDDANIMDVVGILEYDTEFPTSKANHREYLSSTEPNFKEVIPLENEEMKSIVKKTFRLQFLKDVVLIRFLDDHSFNLISDVILDFQTCIIDFLQGDTFLDKLMALYDAKTINESGESDVEQCLHREQKRDGIKLLHQCVLITKNLESNEKSRFYKALVRKGLFNVLDYAFNGEEDSNIRVLATDLVISIIEHDVLLIYSVQSESLKREILDEEQQRQHEKNTFNNPRRSISSDMSLLLILSKILLTDKSPGLKEQAAQALNTLLHPDGCMGAESDYNDQGTNGNMDILMNFYNGNGTVGGAESLHDSAGDGSNFQMAEYFTKFYEDVAPVLFQSLIDDKTGENDDVLSIYLVKLISFISTEHDRRLSREFILENGILASMSKLIGPSHILQLRLTVVRCFKNIMCLNDDFYHRYLISKNLYEPVLELLRENLHKDNLANSCILDFFKIVSSQCSHAKETRHLSKKNFVILNKYLVEKYEGLLHEVAHISFIKEMIYMAKEDYESLKEQDHDVTMNSSLVGEHTVDIEVSENTIVTVGKHKEVKRTFSQVQETGNTEESLTFKRAMDRLSAVSPPASISEEMTEKRL